MTLIISELSQTGDQGRRLHRQAPCSAVHRIVSFTMFGRWSAEDDMDIVLQERKQCNMERAQTMLGLAHLSLQAHPHLRSPKALRDQLCADPGSRGAPTPNRHAKGRLQHDQRRRPKKGRPHARSAVPAVPTLAAGGNHHHHPSWHALVNVK